VPLCNVAGSLPLTPGGIGTFEAAMQKLYHLVAGAEEAQGIAVALLYRLTTFIIAGMGIVYYFSRRREMDAVLRAAEEEREREADSASSS
jgi:uncharacterized membrane protein YbhN (UPF0104 family)